MARASGTHAEAGDSPAWAVFPDAAFAGGSAAAGSGDGRVAKTIPHYNPLFFKGLRAALRLRAPSRYGLACRARRDGRCRPHSEPDGASPRGPGPRGGTPPKACQVLSAENLRIVVATIGGTRCAASGPRPARSIR